jgi:MAF protein
MRLILASGSPRRRELLGALGCDFEVIPADVPEPFTGDAIADALGLARAKAGHVAARHPDDVVLGADTIVFDDERLYAKPEDEADARAMLRSLRGRVHRVVTGMACIRDGTARVDHSIADVTMRDMRDDEIVAYAATGSPLDKAGGYAIQDAEAHPVERFEGCECAIIGLPLWRTARLLRGAGIEAGDPPFERCRSCPDRTDVEDAGAS